QADQKVILLDANMHRPMQAQLFGLPNRGGLSDLLSGEKESVLTLLTPTIVPNLHVLSAGAVPNEPTRLFLSKRLPALLSELVELYDVVIIDTPSLLDQPDGITLCPQVDAVLFVIDARRTRGRSA